MKKGFTLVELLAVIVILGIIAIIAVPTIYNLITDSREKLYNEQVFQIENAAKKWAVENISDDGTNDENHFVTDVSINDLIDTGFLENRDIIDPRDNSTMNGCVKINYSKDYNQYTYKYQENC